MPTSDIDHEEFDFLVPYRKPLLRVDEVRRCLGRSDDFVYAMIDEGKLETHAPTGRIRNSYMITRRSVILLLAEQANYDPSYYLERLKSAMECLNKEQLLQIMTHATNLRSRLA